MNYHALRNLKGALSMNNFDVQQQAAQHKAWSCDYLASELEDLGEKQYSFLVEAGMVQEFFGLVEAFRRAEKQAEAKAGGVANQNG